MPSRLLIAAAVAALLPAWVPAEDPAPPQGPPAATAPAAGPAPAAAPAAVPAAPEREYDSYAVLKGGWFGASGSYQGSSFSGSGTWEVAVGTGRVFGVEVGVGTMLSSTTDVEVLTTPILLSLRLQVPIAFVAPFAELGAGAYLNQVTVLGKTTDDWTAGWHAGFGCDLHFGRLLVGAQARYMGISPTVSTLGTLTLDRYDVLIRAGLRF